MFLKSALTEQNSFNTTEEIKSWLNDKKKEFDAKIEKIKFSEMNQWHFSNDYEVLRHRSGKFFSILGVEAKTNYSHIDKWTQPLIDQPEIGILGIIAKECNGVLYFLMQAKAEPGNINLVQLSPTLQATKSNYTRIHKGKKPLYLDYFLDRYKSEILIDQLQSEHGARFLKKRNRNIIIKVNGDVPVYEDFRWLTLGQIIKLIQNDNVVNMDTRTVVSGIPWRNHGSSIDINDNKIMESTQYDDSFSKEMLKSNFAGKNSLHSFQAVISWLTQLKCHYELNVNIIPLRNLKNWVFTDYEIHHKEQKFFKVIAVNVEIEHREVKKWNQPLIESVEEGICAFIVKKINGYYHFLMQGKVECGNLDVVELAPTVQCRIDNHDCSNGQIPLFLDYILHAKLDQIKCDTMQSEEGGRFNRNQNRHIIIEADENFPEEVPHNYIWMTMDQIKTFLQFNNYINIQARSLISGISFI